MNNNAITTLSSDYNKKKKKKKYAEILPRYRRLFVKGDVIIGEWGILGVKIFLGYNRFFVKGDFVIGGVECISISWCCWLECWTL